MLTVHEHYVYSVVCCPRRACVGPVLRAWSGGNDTIRYGPARVGTACPRRQTAGRQSLLLPTALRLLAHAPEPFIRGELRFAAALADPHVEMNADSRQSPLTPSAESPPPAPTLRGQAVTCSPNGASSSGGDPDPEDLFSMHHGLLAMEALTFAERLQKVRCGKSTNHQRAHAVSLASLPQRG